MIVNSGGNRLRKTANFAFTSQLSLAIAQNEYFAQLRGAKKDLFLNLKNARMKSND